MHRRIALLVCAFFTSGLTYSKSEATPGSSAKRPKKFVIPREAMRKLVGPMGGVFATDRITVDGHKVGYMYREKAERAEDSGWRFFSGDEDQAYIDDLGHTEIYDANTIANYDPDIIPYLDTPAPCEFEKIPGTTKYKRLK
jgi:hypothetical protein